MSFDVVVVGEINADIILKGNVEPAFGQVEQLVDEADLTIGSSAAICACGLARLGLRTTLIGKVGDDLFGRYMIDSLASHHVDTSGVVVDLKQSTGLTVILTKKQDRAILTYPGCIPALDYSEIDLSLLSGSRHLHLASYFLLDALRPEILRLFQAARTGGLTISMDTNFDPNRQWDGGLQEAIRQIDICLLNETEAKAIAGEERLESAVDVLARAVPTVAVKLGRRGALCRRAQEKTWFQKAAPVRVADTVGAGDSFDAGFVYGHLNRWGPARTLQFAVACGSLSTRKLGGTAAQATASEATRFLSRMNPYIQGFPP